MLTFRFTNLMAGTETQLTIALIKMFEITMPKTVDKGRTPKNAIKEKSRLSAISAIRFEMKDPAISLHFL